MTGSTADPRSDLLAAIRASGGRAGAGLKPVGSSSEGPKKTGSAAEVNSSVGGASGGDLLSDLAAKLKMRRQGMSGKLAQQGPPASSWTTGSPQPPPAPSLSGTLGKISSMIPPPTAVPQGAEEDDDDGNESLGSDNSDW